MSDLQRDTIFALSSGRPPAAIAVVRISGPRARIGLESLAGRLPAPRQASLARLRDPASGEIIDEALALWFPAPRSETGEDMAELQLHGGRAVIAAVLAALGRLGGFRPAEAGEFTRRAFENGRMDLTAVEGLADLIAAETEAQRRQAFRQLKGLLGDRAETWRGRLIDALALAEAGIDFSDEADVPQDLLRPALAIARELHGEISAALAQAGHGERMRDGLVVAIAGPPNAGKSTLLNRIAKREAAIVSPYAGTTRDVIEVHLDLHGYPVTLLDTAGVRDTDDPVEQEGVRRARERASAADLVLWVVAADEPMAEVKGGLAEISGAARPLAELMRTTPVWLIRNKADLLPPSLEQTGPQADVRGSSPDGTGSVADLPEPAVRAGDRGQGASMGDARPTARAEAPAYMTATKAGTGRAPPASDASPPSPPASAMERHESKFITEHEFGYSVSALSGQGIDSLIHDLDAFSRRFFSAESGLITRQRHRHLLEETRAALGRALAADAAGEEIIAEELRLASRALGRLTGKVDVEDILDVIFRDFCIGK